MSGEPKRLRDDPATPEALRRALTQAAEGPWVHYDAEAGLARLKAAIGGSPPGTPPASGSGTPPGAPTASGSGAPPPPSGKPSSGKGTSAGLGASVKGALLLLLLGAAGLLGELAHSEVGEAHPIPAVTWISTQLVELRTPVPGTAAALSSRADAPAALPPKPALTSGTAPPRPMTQASPLSRPRRAGRLRPVPVMRSSGTSSAAERQPLAAGRAAPATPDNEAGKTATLLEEPRVQREAGRPSRLAKEMDYVLRLRALVVRDPEQALILAEEGARRFAGGAFAEEREALAIVALAKVGFTDDARVKAKLFLRRYPESHAAARIRKIAGSAAGRRGEKR